MVDQATLKERVRAAVERHAPAAIEVAQEILRHPETCFRERNTSRLVQEWFRGLGLPYQSEIALTGVRADIKGGRPGPTIAVMGELDALTVPGHPFVDPVTNAAHACGHHCQIGIVLAVAAALNEPEIRSELAGTIALMAVPAEEFIELEYRQQLVADGKLEFMAGKAEMVKLGAFDDVQMAMLTHANSQPKDGLIAVGAINNGVIAKTIRFIGRSAHAGGSPYAGINALKAAMLASTAIDANRDTFKDEDAIRVHHIITKGGEVVNAVPGEARMEMFVRGRGMEAIWDACKKVDRSLKAGALALGAEVEITTIPSYLPIQNNDELTALFRGNAESVLGAENVTVATPRGGSTDVGDISHLMPTIQPYAKGAVGVSHGPTFVIEDYNVALTHPASITAMTIVDLLGDGARRGQQIVDTVKPALTRQEYLKMLRSFNNVELFSEA
jgi:amidohydrolase